MRSDQFQGTLLHVTAVHEAAHAVVGHLRGQFVRERGLSAQSDGIGHAHTRSAAVVSRSIIPAELRAAFDGSMEMECATHLAGYVAERRLRGNRWRARRRAWESADYLAAMQVVNQYLGRPQLPIADDPLMILRIQAVERLVHRIFRRAAVWETVLALAEAVIVTGTLESGLANKILEERLPGPWMSHGGLAGEKARTARVFE